MSHLVCTFTVNNPGDISGKSEVTTDAYASDHFPVFFTVP